MKIRLTQLDGSLPNLALMKLSHFFKSEGHDVFFTYDIYKNLFEPDYDLIFGSVIFKESFNKVNIFKREFPTAILGGTGSQNIEYSVEDFIKKSSYEYYDYSIYNNYDKSIGFSSRGCRLKCSFCVVPTKEGKLKNNSIITDIWKQNPNNKKKHIILLDNDFFGQKNYEEKINEILENDFKISFIQGINIRLINKKSSEILSKIKFRDKKFKEKRIYTAWDNKKDENIFLRGINYLLESGIKPHEIMVYFLCNFWNKGLSNDVWYRFNTLTRLGIKPYPMIFDRENPNTDKKLKDFQRWVIKNIYHTVDFNDYSYQNLKIKKLNNKNQLRLIDVNQDIRLLKEVSNE